MTTKLKNTLLSFSEALRKGQTILCSKNEDLSDKIEEIVKALSPNHDPCRLFKAGDVVEYRPKDGRANPNLLVGRRYKVSADEPCDSGIVQVEFDGLRHLDTVVAYNNLQLVTPIEELEALYINPIFDCDDGNQIGWEIAHADGLTEAIIYGGENYRRTLEEALAAAEAERDRLNNEYRKEQK